MPWATPSSSSPGAWPASSRSSACGRPGCRRALGRRRERQQLTGAGGAAHPARLARGADRGVRERRGRRPGAVRGHRAAPARRPDQLRPAAVDPNVDVIDADLVRLSAGAFVPPGREWLAGDLIQSLLHERGDGLVIHGPVVTEVDAAATARFQRATPLSRSTPGPGGRLAIRRPAPAGGRRPGTMRPASRRALGVCRPAWDPRRSVLSRADDAIARVGARADHADGEDRAVRGGDGASSAAPRPRSRPPSPRPHAGAPRGASGRQPRRRAQSRAAALRPCRAHRFRS